MIQSEHRHDYRRCGCGATAIDGGDAYTRILWNEEVGFPVCPYCESTGIESCYWCCERDDHVCHADGEEYMPSPCRQGCELAELRKVEDE